MYHLVKFACHIWINKSGIPVLSINGWSYGLYDKGYLINAKWFYCSGYYLPVKYEIHKIKRNTMVILRSLIFNYTVFSVKNKYIITYTFSKDISTEKMSIATYIPHDWIHPMIWCILKETVPKNNVYHKYHLVYTT